MRKTESDSQKLLKQYFTEIYNRQVTNIKTNEVIESKIININLKEYPEKNTFKISYKIFVNHKEYLSDELSIDVPKSMYSYQEHKTNITVARIVEPIKEYKHGISANMVYINFDENYIAIGNFLVIKDIEVAKKIIDTLKITDEEFKNNVSRRLQTINKLEYKNKYTIEKWESLPKLTKDWVIDEIKNFEITDKVINKLKFLLHKQNISKRLDLNFINMLIEIHEKKLNKITPLDIAFIDFDHELLNYLKNNRFAIVIRVIEKLKSNKKLYESIFQTYIKRYLNGLDGSVRNLQETQDTNPLTMAVQGRKVYFLSSFSADASDKAEINIDNFMGIIDAVATTEKQPNIANKFTNGVSFKQDKMYIKVYDTFFNEKDIPLEEYLLSPILTHENINYKTKTIIKNKDNMYSCYYYGDYTKKPLEEIPYYRHLSTLVSPSTARIPFINMSYMGRTMYGAIQQGQSIPTVGSDVTIIDTGADFDVYNNFLGHIRAVSSGTIVNFKDDIVTIERNDGELDYVELKHEYDHTMTHNFNKYVPRFKVGDKVEEGDVLFSYNSFDDNGALKISTPALVAFMTYNSYENNDSNVISQSFAKKLATEEEYVCEICLSPNKYKININPMGRDVYEKLGLPKPGDVLNRNDKIFEYGEYQDHTETGRIYSQLRGHSLIRSKTYFVPYEIVTGTVKKIEIIKMTSKYPDEYKKIFEELDTICYKYKRDTLGKNFEIDKEDYEDKGYEVILKVYITYLDQAVTGSKLSLLNGNKNTTSMILRDDLMPRLKDGRIVDVIISPLSTVPRMLGSQTYMLYLGKLAFDIHKRLINNDVDDDLVKALKMLYPEEKNVTASNILRKYSHNNFLRFKFYPYDNSINIESLKEIMRLAKVPEKEKVYDSIHKVWVRESMDVGYLDILYLYIRASKKITATPSVLYTDQVRGYGRVRGYKGGNTDKYDGNQYGDNINETLLATSSWGAQDEMKTLMRNRGLDLSSNVIAAFDQIMLRLTTSPKNFNNISIRSKTVRREYIENLGDALIYSININGIPIEVFCSTENKFNKFVTIPDNLSTKKRNFIMEYLYSSTGKNIYKDEILKAPLFVNVQDKFIQLK